ncbi:MAG: WbuC family cupin fold metalloprotein [Oxalobacteraceae bacterium]
MTPLKFSTRYLDELIAEAERSPRRRQFRNVHRSMAEPAQRLFNAIEPDSYIRPHRHLMDPRDETLIAVRGLFALTIFNDEGVIADIVRLASEKYLDTADGSVGVELPSGTWHSLVALVPGSVLMEVKAGPFNPQAPKEFAPWSPEEGSAAVQDYLAALVRAAQAAV